MYALYCPKHVDDEVVVGKLLDLENNISCYIYDRRSVGEKTSLNSNISLRSSRSHRTAKSPRLKTYIITRPCDRAAAAFTPYEWNCYSHIPNVFQIRVEKVRKIYEAEDFDSSIDNSKVRGTWRVLTDKVFSDFVFFEKDDRTDGEKLPIVLLSEEASGILTSFCDPNHIIRMSRGIIKNGRAHVTEGPLGGYDDRIVKVDRHKRLAWVRLGENIGRIGMGNVSNKKNMNVLTCGLEIYEKS
ncbi:MAG: hypothetical protein LUI14_10850 [Lachnospiraceae bacterium]|nr:hypothetical protein [Lachnospiraceae bacterium]